MDNNIYIGYLSGPFGIKGEVKLLYENNHFDKVLKKGNKLLINNEPYVIKSVRNHKNNYLVLFEGFEDINLIDGLLKKDVYIKRDDVLLAKDEFFYSDLYDCAIICNTEKIGVVQDVLYNKQGIFIKDGTLIIPLVPKYFDFVDIEAKIIYVKDCKELIL